MDEVIRNSAPKKGWPVCFPSSMCAGGAVRAAERGGPPPVLTERVLWGTALMWLLVLSFVASPVYDCFWYFAPATAAFPTLIPLLKQGG